MSKLDPNALAAATVAMANEMAKRKGVPPLKNPLDLMSPAMRLSFMADAEAAVSAYLSALPVPGEVVAKTLEWRELTNPREDGPPEPTGDWEADSVAGYYHVYIFGDHYEVTRDNGDYVEPWCGDAIEAKAAAQADYEARIRSTLADPIPEAPADEEVGGPNVGLARDEWLAAASSPQIERWALKWADVLLDALRRSTKTDKPGVREAANLVTVNAGLYNQGRADAFEKAAALCDKLAVTAEKTGEQFGAASPARDQHFARKGAFLEIAFAIRALSASPLTEEQPVPWQDIATAPKVADKTLLLRIEHMNFAIAPAEDKTRWEEVVTAYWTDFNNGGWVWHGLAGVPTHWTPLPPLPRSTTGGVK